MSDHRAPVGEVPVGEVHLVADTDATAAGRAARALIDAGVRVAVFVGDADDDVCGQFVTEVVR